MKNIKVIPPRKKKKKSVTALNSYFKRKTKGLVKSKIEPYTKKLHTNQAQP